MESLKKTPDVVSVLTTEDHEDHSFYGIMFDLEVKTGVPISALCVDSISVRGDLGDITVFHAPKPHNDIYSEAGEWSKITTVSLAPSLHFPSEIKFPHAISLRPGSRTSFFVFSSNRSNGIVYDEERNPVTFENSLLKIYSGLATTSNMLFCALEEPWWPWRPHREFVGKLGYSATFASFRPITQVARKFSKEFLNCAKTFVMAMKKKKALDVDMIYSVLNMISFDWFHSNPKELFNLNAAQRDEGKRIGWRTQEIINNSVIPDYYQLCINEHKRRYMMRKDREAEFESY